VLLRAQGRFHALTPFLLLRARDAALAAYQAPRRAPDLFSLYNVFVQGITYAIVAHVR